MLKIIDVDYIKDFKLKLKFNNGISKVVDLESHLQGELLGELLNHDEFIQYGLTHCTLEWSNGVDLAPEFLYEIGEEEKETVISI